jgi:hypothetical protein
MMPIIDVKDAQFPVLVGTEKQVEWAKNIRRGYFAAFELEIVWGQQDYVLKELKKAAMTVDDLRARIFSETSAHVWIEIRKKRIVDLAVLTIDSKVSERSKL